MATPVAMPSLGMVMTEGTVARWLVPDGASVEKGQPVVEIETDKLSHQIESPAGGIVHHAAAEGQTLPVEGLIAWVLAPGEPAPAPAAPGGPAPLRSGEPASPRGGDGATTDAHPDHPLAGSGAHAPARPLAGSPVRPAPQAPARPLALGWPSPSAPLGPRLAVLDAPRTAAPVSPAARRLAGELGVDLARLRGTGPGGRVVEVDVRAAVAAPQPPTPARQPPRVLTRLPFTGMRRAIADRMTRSLAGGAQLTLTREVDASALVAARRALRSSLAGFAARNGELPYDAFFVRALARALADDPALNAVVEGDEILVLADVHVGVAVAVPGGLLVPVVRDAATRPLAAIARDVADLAERARAGRLSPDDLAGGTVTITNLGAQGVDVFTPILNPPQSAILGIGRIAPRPVALGDALAVRPTVHFSLTFDHRVADGVPAAELLARVARLLSDQAWLMADG